MKKLHDIDLMEHADGEADHGDLLRDPAARAKVEGIGELGELVRGHLELSADAVPAARFEQIWDVVEKGISQAPEKKGIWHGVGGWFERYRGHVITGVVSAGAVAALALVLRGGDVSDGTFAQHGKTGPNGNVTPVAYRPTEIESLDTPGGDSTVFNLDDEDGPATVIWVTPADTVEGI